MNITNRDFHCPYFGSAWRQKRTQRLTIRCEYGTRVVFPTKAEFNAFTRCHCCCEGWRECSVAKMLNEYYEEAT